MEHLSPEDLSRLVDESPTAEEQAHLDRCRGCAAELEAMQGQTAALAALPDVRPPRGDWDGLEARLRAEGLLREERRPDVGFDTQVVAATPWIRRAAAIVLFLAGAATGAGVMARVGLGADEGPLAEGGSAAVTQVAAPTDAGAALAQMQDAERAYIDALAHYRQLIGAQGGDELGDPATRYAALEQLVQAGQAAVSQAPADPFLNGLLASALAEQRVVSRRLAPTAGQDGWF